MDEYLRAQGHSVIYLVGDSAAARDPRTGREVAATAQVAVQEGRAAARNLLRRLKGRPEQPFMPRIRGMFASVGRYQGVGQIGAEQLQGLPAVLAKRLVEAHHAYETGELVQLLTRAVAAGRAGLRRARLGSGARAEVR